MKLSTFPKQAALLLCGALSLSTAQAREGMWMLPHIKETNLAEMQAMGLQLSAEDIYSTEGASLMNASVIFGGGCTGEFISSQGLLLTNHHCGYSYIQQHSSVEHDYLTDGFWAMDKSQELPSKGLTVKVMEKVEEVTDYVKEELQRINSNDSLAYLSSSLLDSIAQNRAGRDFLEEHPGILVSIKPFFGGNRYYMFTQKEFSDVRMVGAPPSSIGKFGSDTDNWMWPRHTGDFSIFRVYGDSLGNPAPYSEANIPITPKRHLTLSTKGISEEDFVMILGYPGRTNHFYTASEVMERVEIENQIRVEVRDVKQRIMLEEMLSNPKVKIQYASKYASSTNSYKSSKGMNVMIHRQGLVAKKEQEEAMLLAYGESQGDAQYQEALTTINRLVKERAPIKRELQYMTEAIFLGIEFSRVPYNYKALSAAIEGGNKDSIATEWENYRQAIEKFDNKDYAPHVDKRIAKAMLQLYKEQIPVEKLPSFFQVIDKKYRGSIDRYVDELFENSIFVNKELREKFFKRPSLKKLERDGMLQFALSARSRLGELYDEAAASDQEFALAQRTYIEGFLAMQGDNCIFPDANFTQRLTYGKIASLRPSDAMSLDYQTTMEGIFEKEDPTNWEFVVPSKLKELYNASNFGRYALPDGRMPVAFIADTHTTGGNSGSPVLNAEGKLVGLGFDRNWEGISGDIAYNSRYQRTIAVDIRYILFIIDKYAGVSYLVKEMDVD